MFSGIEIIVLLFSCTAIKRDTLDVILFFFAYQYLTDFHGYYQYLALCESAFFLVVIFWLEKRPNIPSYPRSSTVQLGFYYGEKSPKIAKIPSYLAYPVYGIAVIIDDRAMTTRKDKIVCRSRESLSQTKWIIIDTQIEVTDELNQAFENLEGNEVKYAGCMKALSPFLSLLGDYKPITWSPAGYLEQVLGLR